MQAALDVPLPERVRCDHDTYATVHAGAAERLRAAGVAEGDGFGTPSPGASIARGQVPGLLARSLDVRVKAGRSAVPQG